MQTKTLALFGIATAGLLGIAFVVSTRSDAGASGVGSNAAKFCPELSAKLNDVAGIEVEAKDASFKLGKHGATWGATEKGGYPVDFGKVKQLVGALADAEVLAEMTKNVEFHARLGVEDPKAEESASKRVTLKDSAGSTLADVIVGKPRENQGYGGRQSFYVRRAGSDQAYEVSGQLTVSGELSGWLDRDVSKIESSRVKSVNTAHADGARVRVSKAAPTDQNFTVEDLPAGAELMWAGVANGLASALQYMSLEDVQRNENFDSSGATTTEFACFDGLVVTARTIEKDGKVWMTLTASVDESLRAAPDAPVGPPIAPEESAAPELEPDPKPAELKPLDDVRKEVEELNRKWNQWVYAVPGYNAANLRKHMSDMLKQDTPAPAADNALAPDLLPPDLLPKDPTKPDDPEQDG